MSSTLRLSAFCWLVAIGAGVFETVLVALGAGDVELSRAALWTGVSIRSLVFVIALGLVGLLMRGSRTARWALTVLLGILGLASIVVPALMSLADGHSVREAFSDDGHLPLAFAISRIAHVCAVVVATALMWSTRLNPRNAPPPAD